MARIDTTSQGLGAVTGYVRPEVVVETDWAAAMLTEVDVRFIEADEDVLLYELGHIPGAIKLDWRKDVQNNLERDFIDQKSFALLMSRWGITNDTTVVFYGDKSNWFACYAFWLFSMYGHQKLKILNGGRAKWETEQRPMTAEVPYYEATQYYAQPANETVRAFRDYVAPGLKSPGRCLIDVRSQQEFSGELVHMVNYPQEGALRSGHIPGAKNIPWATATNEDGTFKPADELRMNYFARDITPDKEVIVYCRIGERSAHTWFVLTQLLGYPRVRNYDGSWTEWGNVVRAPIER